MPRRNISAYSGFKSSEEGEKQFYNIWHLVGEHKNRLNGEAPRAEIKEIFQRRSEEVHDQDVVVALGAVPPDVGDPDAPLKDLIELRLVQKLRVSRLDGLELKK